MKKYKTLFFDVDDTLLDFGAAEENALQLLFEEYDKSLAVERISEYGSINQLLWKQFEEGRIDRHEVLNTRFSKLFEQTGQKVDGALMESQYRQYLEKGHKLIDGAFELVSDLRHRFDLYIVTNGVSTTQEKRLKASGLFPMFKAVYVSEDTGYQKPMKQFFDYVFEQIPDFSPEKGLIIGDSLTSDIKGGNMAGLDTCWFNPHNKANHSDISPTYEIQELHELQQLLINKNRPV